MLQWQLPCLISVFTAQTRRAQASCSTSHLATASFSNSSGKDNSFLPSRRGISHPSFPGLIQGWEDPQLHPRWTHRGLSRPQSCLLSCRMHVQWNFASHTCGPWGGQNSDVCESSSQEESIPFLPQVHSLGTTHSEKITNANRTWYRRAAPEVDKELEATKGIGDRRIHARGTVVGRMIKKNKFWGLVRWLRGQGYLLPTIRI